MSDPLYAKDLLRLAAMATGAGTLNSGNAKGGARNPVCGDAISVNLEIDALGRVVAMAHETHACVLTQASASILGTHLAGADKNTVEHLRADVAAMLAGGETPGAPFQDYATLTGAAQHRNRHTCVLLPIDAVLDALRGRD
jgi:NifU-like protein involved in Fe-S cluster formation